MKRLVKVLVATIVALALLNGLAFAAWTSASAGDAAVTAADMPAGNISTVTSSGASVTVNWTESTIGTPPQTIGGLPGGSYQVYVHEAAVGGQSAPFCAPTKALTCTSDHLEAGTYYFSVQPLLRNWTGQESARIERTVVTTGAAVNITFPANAQTYSPTTFLAGCLTAESDACGSAAAAPNTQLTEVQASLRSHETDMYLDWNVGAFTSADPSYAPLTEGAWNLAIPSLEDGGYTLEVKAADSNGIGGSASSAFVLDSTPPATPATVALTTPAQGASFNTASVSFSGTASDRLGDSETVTVKLYEGTGTEGALLETRQTTREAGGSWSVASQLTLESGTYSAQAEQANILGGVGFSTVNTFSVTLLTAPSAPTSLTATAASATRIDVAWNDASANEAGFKVQRSATGSENTWTEIADLPAGTATYADSGLSCGQQHFYRVVAHNTAGQSISNTANTTTSACPTPAPTAPTNLQATGTQTTIALSWTDNANNETGYAVERSSNGTTGWTEITTVAANVEAYNDTSLTCGERRYYRVRAIKDATPVETRYSAYTDIANATTTACSPAAPSSLSEAASTATTVSLSWTDNATDESGFQVERSGGTGGTITFTRGAQAGNGQAVTYKDTTATCQTAYTYRVRALSTTAPASSYTTPVNVTTGSCANVRVDTIDLFSMSSNGNATTGTWTPTIRILVTDLTTAKIADVTVYGTWSSAPTTEVACTTTSSGGNLGTCRLTGPTLTKGTNPSVTFTVTRLTHASRTYEPNANEMESLVVNRP